MSKPTVIPEWASNGVEVVEPSAPKKVTGWADGEKPRHSYMNWLQNAAWQWVVWLNGLQAEALTWSALNTFSAGVVVTQSTTNGDAITATGDGTGSGANLTGGALGAGLTVTKGAGASAAILADGDLVSTTGGLVLAGDSYVGGNELVNGTLGVTGATSLSGNVGCAAQLNVAGVTTLTGQLNANGDLTATGAIVNGTTSLNGAAVTADLAVGGNGGTTGLQMLTADTDSPAANTLTRRNITKAWAHIALNGTAAPTVQAAMNIASVVVTASRIVFTFTQAFNSSVMCPVAMLDSNASGYHVYGESRTSTTLKLEIRDDTHALIDAATISLGVSLIVDGVQ